MALPVRAQSLVFPFVALTAVALAPALAEASRVVYVNTDPITITAGANDPSMDQIAVNGFTDTDFDGWAGATPEQVEQLLVLLKDTSVAFDIIYTLERPTDGEYDMVVFGSADDHMSSFGGTCSTQVGISDCGDQGGVSIGFAYWGCLAVEDQLDPERVAFHTLGALGYGWGLENISGTGQIMASWSGTALKFGDACANINGGSGCTHAECGAGQQNSSADLLANIGARVDDGPPTLTVLEPQPGADVTEPFNVVIEIDDAFGGLSATLELVDSGVPPVPDDTWPFGWNDLQIGTSGPVTLRITAIDADGNETTTDVPICIGGGCPDTGDGDGDASGDGDGDGSGGTEGGDVGASDDGGDGGCSCSTERSGPVGGALMLLGLVGALGLRRRRD